MNLVSVAQQDDLCYCYHLDHFCVDHSHSNLLGHNDVLNDSRCLLMGLIRIDENDE